jgi:hypothetical protein
VKERIAHNLYSIRDLYNIQDLYKVVNLNKGFDFFKPVGFRVALRGGWLNPVGNFAANVAVNYEHLTLQALKFNDHNLKGKTSEIALHKGWVKFSYQQSYSKFVLNTMPVIKKKLTI